MNDGNETDRALSWAGEARLGWMRLAALMLLGGYYLVGSYVCRRLGSPLPHAFTALAALLLCWGLAAAAVQLSLYRRPPADWLKYAVVGLDTLLVTLLLARTPDPESPLLALYFVVLASTPLRLSTRLVWATTAGTVAAYLGLVGYYILVDVGWTRYASNLGLRLSLSVQLLIVLALLGAGLLAGWTVYLIRGLVDIQDRHSVTSYAWEKRLGGVALLVLGLLTVLAVPAVAARWRPSEEGTFAAGAALQIESRAGVACDGPVWHPELGVLFGGPPGDLYRLDRQGELHVQRKAEGICGQLFDPEGRLLACEARERRVTRTERDGRLVVLTDRYQGQRYNTPNDLALDGRGRIYFSDPRYGDRDDLEVREEHGQIVEGVYRIDPDGAVTRVIGRELERPNGLLVSADDRYLFVTDSSGPVGNTRQLVRFDLRADGTVDLASRKLLYDWGERGAPDGMKADQLGRLYVASTMIRRRSPLEPARRRQGAVYVFSPEGELLDHLAVPREFTSNCGFGGDDLKTLYVTTSSGNLYSIRTTTPGRVAWPAVR